MLTLAHIVLAKPECRVTSNAVQVTNGTFRLETNLLTGRYNCRWTNQSQLLSASCECRLSDGTTLATTSYTHHSCSAVTDVAPLKDSTGTGIRVTVHHTATQLPELRQEFDVYDDGPSFFITSLTVVSDNEIGTNKISPLVADSRDGGLRLSTKATPVVLFVPFDNDAWVRFNNAHDPAKDPDSYEVTAIFDNASRQGVVIGSVRHDLWKTGIESRDLSAGAIGHLRVYGGATGSLSRDSQPHGVVTGRTVTSPPVMVGSYDDWRDGLEEFGRTNGRVSPPLVWAGGPIFGWNSWAAYGGSVDLAKYTNASDFIHSEVQSKSFNNNDVAYINWDASWNKCTPDELRTAARHAHENGQKAGIYFSPFTLWNDKLEKVVEGTDGKYVYGDLLLRDSEGKPLPRLDGGQPLDPTHPGTLAHVDWQLDRFVDWGYDFVKLDFLNAAVLEGRHFDPAVSTGVAAYNLSMKRIVADLAPEKIGRSFFISLSIAPVFPAGFGHSRRISCDAFGEIRDTEYMLNSLSYGWWQNGSVYTFNDPDHIVLWRPQHPSSLEEARSRVNASAIAGTTFINSDDFTDPTSQQRAAQLLTNPQINALARSGRTFRPIEADASDRASNCFVREDPDGIRYVAAFNFNAKEPATVRVKLDRIGVAAASTYRLHDLWDDTDRTLSGDLTIALPPAGSKIVRLTPAR
jgi:hypothetical protein